MPDTEKKRAEAIRHAVLEALAVRHPAALPVPGVRRAIQRDASLDFEPTPAELSSALELLIGLGYVERVPDPLGATNYYKATAAGLLHWEREG